MQLRSCPENQRGGVCTGSADELELLEEEDASAGTTTPGEAASAGAEELGMLLELLGAGVMGCAAGGVLRSVLGRALLYSSVLLAVSRLQPTRTRDVHTAKRPSAVRLFRCVFIIRGGLMVD